VKPGPEKVLAFALRVMVVLFIIAWWMDFVGLADVGWGPA
jgi:hypothetical protein